jgi:hypothetical protein
MRGAATLSLALIAVACGSSPTSATGPSDGGLDVTTESGSNSDATADSLADGTDLDASVECSSPLSNPGFSSLADLPIAQLCAQSWMGLRNLIESAPCQGIIEVDDETGTDCSEFWLFDATTGALVATGSVCTGPISCTAAPGFQFPTGTGCQGMGWTHLCPDAGTGDGAVPDAQADAATDAASE